MPIILYLVAAPVFLISIIAHIYVKIRLRPSRHSDFDDYYHEFENQHPQYAKYEKWSQITFIAAVASALLLFLALVF